MSKKFIALLMASLLFLSGCASNQSPSQDTTQSGSQSESVPDAQQGDNEPSQASTPTEPANQDGLSGFMTHIQNNPNALRYLANNAFSSDPNDAPTDEELVAMLEFANTIGSAHMLSPAHFIVIRDYEEQSKLLSTGVTEGTVTVLVLADTLRSQEYHEAEYNDWYNQMYYGLFDAGSAMAYLHIAANSMGYGTHPYAALSLPVDGEIDLDNGGKFELIQGESWQYDLYATSKDGSVDFIHTVSAHTLASGPVDIQVKGNLTLLTTIVIGKADSAVDAVSAATQGHQPSNYNIWDPQDGATYGNAIPSNTDVSTTQDAQADTPETDAVTSATE